MSRLIRICDSQRRKSFVKCCPTVANVLEKGRSHFEKELTSIVLEADGSMIVEDEVLDLLSSEGLSFMLLGNSEEWSEKNTTTSVDENKKHDIQQTQTFQEPSRSSSVMDSTLSSIASIELAECDAVFGNVSNVSTLEDPLALPNLSCGDKRKLADSVEETSNKRTKDISTETLVTCNVSEIEEDKSSLQEMETDSQEKEISSKTVDQNRVPRIQQSIKHDLSAPLKLANFQINWKILPSDVMHQLQGHEPSAGYRGISETNYNRLVDHVTAQLRTITTKIPFSIFKKHALKITTEYSVLRDYNDDGDVIGDGSNSLADKLRNHNSYLNRTRRTEKQTTHNKGCSNRQCKAGIREEYYKSGKTYCSKEHLMLLSRNNPESMQLNDEVLTSTEAFIRYKIDSSMTIEKLCQEIPMIRRNELLNYHFFKGTGVDAETFTTNFAKKRTKLIKVAKVYKKSLNITSSASDLEILEGVAKLLHEDFSCLIHELENTDENLHLDDVFPSIIIRNDQFFIYADHELVTTGVNTIIRAVQQLLVVYFVYFFKYPKQISKTLEFLQMYLLKIYPEHGTRSMATIVGGQQRMVASLISKITKLEWKNQLVENER